MYFSLKIFYKNWFGMLLISELSDTLEIYQDVVMSKFLNNNIMFNEDIYQ